MPRDDERAAFRARVLSWVAITVGGLALLSSIVGYVADNTRRANEVGRPIVPRSRQAPPDPTAAVPSNGSGPVGPISSGELEPPDPEWYQRYRDGKLVYEGPAPFEEFAGPARIERRANQDPTVEEVDAIVAEWLAGVDIEPMEIGDLVTLPELKNANGWGALYLVDGRFGLAFRYRTLDGLPMPDGLGDTIRDFEDASALYAHMLNRSLYEFGPDFHLRALQSPAIIQLDQRIDDAKAELQARGVQPGKRTMPLSLETLANLGR